MSSLEALLIMAHESRLLSHNFDVAAVTVYVWDYILTFQLERELIWTSNWNFIKVLFLVQRYLPFFDTALLTLHHQFKRNAGVEICHILYRTQAWTWLIGTMASELLLTLRAWAVWHRPRVLTIALPVLFSGVCVACFILDFYFDRSLEISPIPFPEYHGCFVTGALADLASTNYIIMLAWDTFVLVLMAIPGLRSLYAGSRSALMTTVYRDGVIYYIYLAALSILNVVAIAHFEPGSKFLLISMERIFHSVLASRVLLHIRFQASNNNWSVGLTEMHTNQESDLSAFIALDKTSRAQRTTETRYTDVVEA